MNLRSRRSTAGNLIRLTTVCGLVFLSAASAWAQNRKNSWEVFLYFGGNYAHNIPSAVQTGRIQTYRVEPVFAQIPSDPNQVYTPNLGLVGGHTLSSDPNSVNFPGNYPFQIGTNAGYTSNPPCLGSNAPLGPADPRAPYYDECDNDQESLYVYNAGQRPTNGEIQTDESEFSLGLRAGYNITRHLEVEVDFGFGKQRVDLTKNRDPILGASINPVTDANAFAALGLGMTLAEARAILAEFYQFTWANVDYWTIVGSPSQSTRPEHPFVYANRPASDPNYNIPIYFGAPFCTSSCPAPPLGETFADVTGFVNRVLQDPTAFRNRGDQINIDNFTLSASANWNFNTKADSRVIPYVGAGIGRWMRNFDKPWQGNDTNFVTGQAGIRFFVNEIFSFRADARYVSYVDDSFTIKASLPDVNLVDRIWQEFQGCVRDSPVPEPSAGQLPDCDANPLPIGFFFPDLGVGGGEVEIQIDAELDDFFEIRFGFDVILGGK